MESDGVTNGGVLCENSLDMTVSVTFSSTCQVNVLPSVAEAYVNLRIHSAQSLQEVRLKYKLKYFASFSPDVLCSS